MSILLNNKVLQAAEQKIEDNLLPANHADYMKVVVAGMHAGLANGPKSILAGIRNSSDPVNDCAKGAVNLAMLLRKQSRGTMPLKAMIPAAMTLMLHALDFVDKSGMKKIGTPELVEATHTFANFMFKQIGLSPQMLQKAHESVTAVTNDPAHLEAMKRKAGMVKAPDSSTITPVPGGNNAV